VNVILFASYPQNASASCTIQSIFLSDNAGNGRNFTESLSFIVAPTIKNLKKTDKTGIFAGVGVGVGLIVLLSIVAIVLWIMKRRRRREIDNTNSIEMNQNQQTMHTTVGELSSIDTRCIQVMLLISYNIEIESLIQS
jgi:hypothetical protein